MFYIQMTNYQRYIKRMLAVPSFTIDVLLLTIFTLFVVHNRFHRYSLLMFKIFYLKIYIDVW